MEELCFSPLSSPGKALPLGWLLPFCRGSAPSPPASSCCFPAPRDGARIFSSRHPLGPPYLLFSLLATLGEQSGSNLLRHQAMGEKKGRNRLFPPGNRKGVLRAGLPEPSLKDRSPVSCSPRAAASAPRRRWPSPFGGSVRGSTFWGGLPGCKAFRKVNLRFPLGGRGRKMAPYQVRQRWGCGSSARTVPSMSSPVTFPS